MSTTLWIVLAAIVLVAISYIYFWIRFQFWKRDYSKAIREDSIARSQATILGKVTEHLAPLFAGFLYNPKDARFIGTPIDFVIFDGLDEGDLRRIVLLEVKTGRTGNLTTRERLVREAIQSRSISLEWDVLHIKGEAQGA